MSNKVKIEFGISEFDQEGSFMNSTLQNAGPALAISIATEFDVPESVHINGQWAVAEYLRLTLAPATDAVPGLRFDIQIGPSRTACQSLQDGEVLGQEPNGLLVFFDRTKNTAYVSGETVAEYGPENLTDSERARCW